MDFFERPLFLKENGLEERTGGSEETARNTNANLVRMLLQRQKERSATSPNKTEERKIVSSQQSNTLYQTRPLDQLNPTEQSGSSWPVQEAPGEKRPHFPVTRLLQGKTNGDALKPPENTVASWSLKFGGSHRSIIGVEKQSKLFNTSKPAHYQAGELRRGNGNVFQENLRVEANRSKLSKESNKMTVKLPKDLITFIKSSGVIFMYQIYFRNFKCPVSVELGSDLVLSSESSYAPQEALAVVMKDLSVETVKLWGAAAVPPDLDRVKETLINAQNEANRDGLRANVRFFPGLEGNTVTKVRLVGFSDTVNKLNEVLQDHLMNWLTTEEPLRLPHVELVDCFDKFMALVGMTQSQVTLKVSHLPGPHVLVSGPRCKVQEFKQTLVSALACVTSDTLVLDGPGAQRYFQAEGKVSKELTESSCKVFITVKKGVQHSKVVSTSSPRSQHQTDPGISKVHRLMTQGYRDLYWNPNLYARLKLSQHQGNQAILDSVSTDLQEVSVNLTHGVKLQLVLGSITDETTDVVVNSTNFRDFHGGVCNAILSVAGRHLEASLKSAQVKRGAVFITPPGSFPCKSIFHVHGRKKTHVIEQLVRGIIQQCESRQYKSVAIPAICAGAAGLDSQAVAQSILQAIKTSTSSAPLRHLSNIRLVLIEARLFLTFKQQLVQMFPLDVMNSESFLQHRDAQRKQPPDFIPGLLSSSFTGEQSIFLFLGLCRKDVDDAMNKVKDLYQAHCSTKTFPKKDLEYLTEADVTALQELLKTEALHVQEDGQGGLTVSGLKVGVNKVVQMLETTIPLRREMKLKEEENFYALVAWCILDLYGQWEELPKAARYALERGDVAKGIVDKQGQQWSVNLQRMEATRNGRTTMLKRLENRADFILPLYWDNMSTGENLKVVQLQPSSTEYRTVHDSFKRTANNTVTKIERLQNIHLRRTYEVQKQYVSEKNKGQGTIERRLFHGTSQKTCDSIMNNGFNMSFSGKNGTSYGQGTYFAVNASYSVSFA
uniref:Poly [ADP-ribose] polymerase n=1 Tax=Salarias fasciatus TaxID=181472 RepID=A0A672GID0_SALFA